MSTLRILVEIDGDTVIDMPTTEVEDIKTQQINGTMELPSDTSRRVIELSGERLLSVEWFDRELYERSLRKGFKP